MSSDSFIRSLNISQAELQKNFHKLSSGKRITSAADDPAGLAIAAVLNAVEVGLSQGGRNSSYASSAISIADSALEQVSTISSRLQELATQSANGTLSDSQRGALNAEYQQLTQEAQRIGAATDFNGQSLLTGNSMSVQVGADGSSSSQITIGGVDLNAMLSSLTSSAIDSVDGARNVISALQDFTSNVSSARSSLGASDARLQVAAENNNAARIPVAAARAQIEDINVAEVAAELVRRKILADEDTALSAHGDKLQRSLARKLLG
ncbi:MAG: hypothetical protein EBZ48_11525 [Proteobacteria bacterium]|nr:hypothetical protein [Pseudomonadota bacterium]